MRLLAALVVLEGPLAVLVWLARHTHSTGAQGGVYWLLAGAGVLLAILVVGAAAERRLT